MRTYRLPIVAVMVTLLLFGTAAVVAAEQAISVEARVKPILEIDGLQFKDLNDNGVLDPYEDWRLDTEARIGDLISQMTIEEQVGLMFHINTGGDFTPPYPYTEENLAKDTEFILDFNMTHILDNNNGTPDYLANLHNTLQEVAEGSRLGIPIIFSCDRASNTWGGMIDMPHAALGAANDVDLAAALLDAYAKEMKAIGYHLTLHPSAVELFGTWGEDVDWVSTMIETQVEAYVENGVQVCLKHWIAKPFGSSKSPAEAVSNWAQPWAAGFAAGADYVMTTKGQGISDATSTGYYDRPTMEYLRNVLNFDGVVLTDWGPVPRPGRPLSGVNYDGIDMSTATMEELYKIMIDIGYDQFGGELVMRGLDPAVSARPGNLPDAVLNLVESGEVTEARIEESARRILRVKFNLGLFDDPYVDPQAALEIAASPAYIAEPLEITDTVSLIAARNPLTQALDETLQASSTVVLVNDGILPLSDGINVYFMGLTDEIGARESAAISAYANVVEDPADADVAVVRISPQGRRGAWDGSEMALVQAATDAGLPTIVAVDSTSASDLSAVILDEKVAAVLMLTYSVGTDHGSPMGGTFLGKTTPDVLAAMLFGRAAPTGQLVSEMERTGQGSQDWGDIPFDLGATTAEQILIAGAIRNGAPIPTNLSDPLFPCHYGMQYGLDPRFEYSTFVIPTSVQPGEEFTVSCLLTNNGFDGYTTAKLAINGQVVASKFMALVGGEYRVVEFPGIVLDIAGTYTITLGTLSAEVVVPVPEG